MFAFLAGVRNYSKIIPISEPKGLPIDVCKTIKDMYDQGGSDYHSVSWLGVDELTAVDYLSTIEDRRVTMETSPNFFDGGCTCLPGQGSNVTLQKFLRQSFFDDLKKLQDIGAERVVFWFDN